MRLDFESRREPEEYVRARSAWPITAAAVGFAAFALEAGAQSPTGGITAGSFRIDPRLDLERTYTNNVNRSAFGALSDQVTRVMPGLSASSLWTRHALNADLSMIDETHNRLKDESADTNAFSLAGRIDGSAGLAFPLAYERQRSTTARGNPNEQGGRDRQIDTVQSLRGGLHWQTGPWRLELGSRVQSTDARDTTNLAGVTINRDDEDRTQSDHSAKLGYQVNKAWSVFGKAVRTRVDYRDPFDDRLVNRDSDGGTFTAGTSYVLGPSKRFSLEAGNERRKFRGALGKFSDATLDMLAMWDFLPSLVGTATHSRSFQETVLPGSPGLSVRVTTLGLGWTIDPRWRADLTYTRNEMAPERLPERYRQNSLSLATRYTFNRYVQLRLAAAHNTQPADGALVPGYRESAITAGVLFSY
jgi:hypothetical protein